jgi:subtilisin family serine protease
MLVLSLARLRFGCAVILTGALLAACGGGGSTPHPAPTPTATATATAAANEAAYQCPTSDTPAAVAHAASGADEATRRRASGGARRAAADAGLLAVTYDLATATSHRAALAARERSAGARTIQELDYPHLGIATHVISVAPAQLATVAATLRATAGVRSVASTGQRRFASTVTTPYFPSDPYFDGFAGTTAPLHTTAAIPGQWDAHITGLEYAFGYSRANNGSGIVNANALGSSSVKIAVIDTGEDDTHPELHAKIAYQKCFITDPNGVHSTSDFTTDGVGHGTDVAGIAAEVTNNAFGFTAAGGNSTLYAYRVFPTPDDTCVPGANGDAQCGASTADIALAILDAVAHGVNVINLSLGGNECTNGVDQDSVEGDAVAEALAANVIVVAASGNDGSSPVEAPGCDTGVIAAGASALADGQPNGAGNSDGSAANPIEYVASYSDWGTPAASPKSASAWGILAPGGDPIASGNDPDDLHWIENIWTSQPYMSSAGDTNFEGECTDDYPNSSGTTQPVDCRTQIAGTSMSTPRVAGAAALILAVNGAYQSPSAMKTLLCTTADDIGAADEGCGRLNIYRAMAKALNDPAPP